MDTKHTTDTLKTMLEGEIKGGDGTPPSLSQPKKQWCYNCKYHGYNKIMDKHGCHYYCKELDIWNLEPIHKIYECKKFKSQ